MAERTLETEAQFLKGVGPNLWKGLRKLGLESVEDVLWYLPRRYEDRRNLPRIRDLRAGAAATVKGRIIEFKSRPTKGGKVILRAVVSDGSGAMALVWFNQPWVSRRLAEYKGEIIAYGMVKDSNYTLEMQSPDYELLSEEDDPEDFARIVPVYGLSEGVFQTTVRRAVRSALAGYLDLVQEPLPLEFRNKHRLKGLAWSLKETHEPTSEENRLEARRRLVFEEFLYLQLALQMKRAETHRELGIAFPIAALEGGEAIESAGTSGGNRSAVVKKHRLDSHLFEGEQAMLRDHEPLWDQIHRILPFELTAAQRRVIGEIYGDMAMPHPMNRLVQGDVGSGKTAVAACAMLAAVRSGYQAALMAPTEILAEQHAINLRRLLEPLGIEVDLLVGKLSAAEKKRARARVSAGEAKIAVGTHALIQESVEFARLGLVVIDEQHRFGVLQRAALHQKGLGNPDVLVMTATPIPRTLTMTTYGDLDLSVIDELPPGRVPIKTHWKPPSDRPAVYEAVRKLLAQGAQAYFVCPMIEESEKMQTQAAVDLHYRLSTGDLKEFRIGLLHGQLKPLEKESIMESFRKAELDVLVSTTVIEVGVDVPNASVMVIEDANRFGLSQLHQLRGRVGRGAKQSYCILICDPRSEDGIARMQVMVSTSDGFKIAEEDLRLRGPGELAGTAQSGNADFRIADLIQDGLQLELARKAAMDVVAGDPNLDRAEHARMREKVALRRSKLAIVTVS